jgi:hypothetical protein
MMKTFDMLSDTLWILFGCGLLLVGIFGSQHLDTAQQVMPWLFGGMMVLYGLGKATGQPSRADEEAPGAPTAQIPR